MVHNHGRANALGCERLRKSPKPQAATSVAGKHGGEHRGSVPLGEADVFDEEEESGSEEKTEEVEVPKIQVEPQALNYHYGFDEDRKLAWRAPFDNPNKRQYHHGEPEKGNGDHIAVRFKNDDGTEDLHQLEDVSVQDWEEIKAASAMLGKASKSVEPLFWRCFKDNTAAAEIKRVNDKKTRVLLCAVQSRKPRGTQESRPRVHPKAAHQDRFVFWTRCPKMKRGRMPSTS